MRSLKRLGILLVGLAAVLVPVAAPVSSASAADDGAVAYTTFDQSAVSGYRNFSNYYQLSASTQYTLAHSQGCKEISARIVGKNFMNETLFTFQQTADWCWSNGRLTYQYSDFGTTSPFWGWAFQKLIANESYGTNPWIRYREGAFAQCLPSGGVSACPNHAYPWIRMYMYTDGSYRISHGV